MKRTLLLGLCAAALGTAPMAQTSEAPSDAAALGLWADYSLDLAFGEAPVGLDVDLKYRNHTLTGDLDQFQFFMRAEGMLDDALGVAAGGGYVRSEKRGTPDLPADEARTYVEASLRQQALGVRFANRLRVEQRWVEGQAFQTRARYRLSAAVPLGPRSPFTAETSAEVFLRATGREGRSVFDRLRLTTGLRAALADGLSVRLGYVHQAFDASSDGQIEIAVSHALSW